MNNLDVIGDVHGKKEALERLLERGIPVRAADLSPAMRGRLTLATSNGSVRVDPSCEAQVVSERKNHAVLDLGSSEYHSSATTSNGSIQVKRAKDIRQ